MHEQSEGRIVRVDRSDLPLAGIDPGQLSRFREGDGLFEAVFREVDGLGPLYIRASCGDCHRDDGRGPGRVTRFGLGPEVTRKVSAGETLLPLGDTARPYVAAGATEPLGPPSIEGLLVSDRLPPAVFGRGYLEAIDDSEIERLAARAAARSGPIRGRLARVPRAGAEGLGIGRFGLKASVVDLTDFTARALHGDMGLTTPLYPEEPPNPEGLTDDLKPGVDVALESVELMADYVRLLALPRREAPSDSGGRLFSELNCATCHTPSLRTRSAYPVTQLAGIEAPVYTDLLLHDMGEHLADGVSEGDAGPREWRTAPLVGLRFSSAFLHDGRAESIEEAIVQHAGPGSEANASIAAFEALDPESRRLLIEFVSGL